jgi:hypothetical protein
MSVSPALGRKMWEDCEFQAKLGFIVRTCLKTEGMKEGGREEGRKEGRKGEREGRERGREEERKERREK